MRTIDIAERVTIEQPTSVVRAQFGDVAHHQETGVHRGVRFELVDDNGERCHYRQTSRVGPISLRQELTLERSPDGPLVNRITGGVLAGGTITFHIQSDGPCRSVVTAVVAAELRGVQALVAPLVRSQVARDLRAALIEDKADLELGRYPSGA